MLVGLGRNTGVFGTAEGRIAYILGNRTLRVPIVGAGIWRGADPVKQTEG